MKRFLLIVSFIFFACFSSCTKKVVKVKSDSPISLRTTSADYQACREITEVLLIDEVNFSELPVNFENVKDYVFKNNCASCHFGEDSYLPHLNDYHSTLEFINLKDPSESRLLKAIESGKMPPSYELESRDANALRFLRKWVNKGAQR